MPPFVIFAPQEAHAMQEKVSAQYKNEIDMAKAQRDYELKKAAYDIEVNTKKAESEMAYQLQVFTRFTSTLKLGGGIDKGRFPWFAQWVEMTEVGSSSQLPGSKDEAAHRRGKNASAGGWADTADHAAGAGNHPQGERAGG